MSKIQDNLAALELRIDQACQQHHARRPLLLAVSKTRTAAELAEAYQLGLRRFGENYLQEALDKQAQLSHCAIEWHFIGPIQSNKARAVAENFSWVHSVDRLKVAQKLSAVTRSEPLNICLQVNIDAAPSKSGVLPEHLPELLEHCLTLPNLRPRGLMAIPDPAQGFAAQKAPLQRLADLLSQCQADYPDANLDTLSMGMSGDLAPAIAAGSTLVRVGTDLFGPRPATQKPTV